MFIIKKTLLIEEYVLSLKEKDNMTLVFLF